MRDLRRLVRFGAAGGVTTVVTYGIYVALLEFGLPYNAALALEYAVGIGLGFVLNRVFTFADRHDLERPLARYVVTYAVVFLLNLVLLNALVFAGLHPVPAQAVALGLATLASYLLQRNWVFRPRSATARTHRGSRRKAAADAARTEMPAGPGPGFSGEPIRAAARIPAEEDG